MEISKTSLTRSLLTQAALATNRQGKVFKLRPVPLGSSRPKRPVACRSLKSIFVRWDLLPARGSG